jgi:hypothetical protein
MCKSNRLDEPITRVHFGVTNRRALTSDVRFLSLGNAHLSQTILTPIEPTEPLSSTYFTMASSRLVVRSSRAFLTLQRTQCRTFSISTLRNNEFEALNKRTNDTSEIYRKYQKERPLNPHLTNTTSTIANEMPSVGNDAAPPELITGADSKFTPKDSVPENTERMTGGTQSSKDQDVSGANGELGVGEMEGAKFKVEPIKRTGEDPNTMRARLLCPFLHLFHPVIQHRIVYCKNQ